MEKGTDRLSHDFGVLHTGPPDSVIEREAADALQAKPDNLP